MKRSRRILAGAVLVVALMAAAGALVHHFAWRGPPPHLAKRLPPIEAMPADLTADQQAAIHLLYSPNPSDRMHGLGAMDDAGIPPDVQVPYLVALMADDPKLQNERQTSPLETWFWKLLGTKWSTEDVAAACHDRLAAMDTRVITVFVEAMRAEKDVRIRQDLVAVIPKMSLNQLRAAMFRVPRPIPPPPWCPDPTAMDALQEAMRTDPDGAVREAAIEAFLQLEEYLTESAMNTAGIPWPPEEEGALPNQAAPLGPQQREALLAAAFQDPVESIRAKALTGVACTLGPGAVAPLAESAATDTSARVRDHAGWLLASPGTKPILEGNNLYSRSISGKGGNPCHRPRLVEALIDALRQEAVHPRGRSSEIRAALHSALCDLTDQDFGQDAAKWQAWFDKHEADFYR